MTMRPGFYNIPFINSTGSFGKPRTVLLAFRPEEKTDDHKTTKQACNENGDFLDLGGIARRYNVAIDGFEYVEANENWVKEQLEKRKSQGCYQAVEFHVKFRHDEETDLLDKTVHFIRSHGLLGDDAGADSGEAVVFDEVILHLFGTREERDRWAASSPLVLREDRDMMGLRLRAPEKKYGRLTEAQMDGKVDHRR